MILVSFERCEQGKRPDTPAESTNKPTDIHVKGRTGLTDCPQPAAPQTHAPLDSLYLSVPHTDLILTSMDEAGSQITLPATQNTEDSTVILTVRNRTSQRSGLPNKSVPAKRSWTVKGHGGAKKKFSSTVKDTVYFAGCFIQLHSSTVIHYS
ncbi:hypothetical protein MHYP_G00051670 [Metynnis hypsauchen]